MKISYNWLKQFIKTDWNSEETATLLTDLGLEVEGIEKYQSVKGGLKGVVVGQVITCDAHPDADKLKVTTVAIAEDTVLQIVCGASNVAIGQKVAVATIGTVLLDKEDKEFTIKKGKIRGVESFGMLCAEDELGLGDGHDGILVLNDSQAIGTAVASIYDIENDEVFEIGLTPNRADAMSHLGIARDLRAGMLQKGINAELITPSISSFNVDMRTLKMDVTVEEAQLIPRYCGVTISGVQVGTSPKWLQDRLKAIGITPKNNIVDVTNYVLHDLGQPLHAFDVAKIQGKIIVKILKEETKFITLDGIERTLHPEDIMICDDKKPLCIAGILGGKNSGVTETTTTIFLESAYFNPISIRKTAKRQQLSTDASYRFERGIDPAITVYALKRAALLIQEVAGGKITSDLVDVYSKKAEDFSVLLNFANVKRIIGQEIPKDTIKKILVSLDIKVTSVSETGLGLLIPPYRVDVQREIDVIEEILRVYGYNNISTPKKINATMFNAPREEDYKVQNSIAAQLNAQGFYEIMSNSLSTENYTALSEQIKEDNNVVLLNPLSADLSTMRQSLLFSGLEAVAFNINRKNSNLRFFEFGKTYHKYLSGFEEHKCLGLFVTGNTASENWLASQKSTDFFLLKGYVEAILLRLGLQKSQQDTTISDVFSEGFAIKLGHNTLVEMGVVKKSILKTFGIKQEVFFANFNWDNILKSISGKIKFVEIPKYPEVKRDLALLLNQDISYDSLVKIAQKTEKSLLKSVNLFDVYQGDNLPKGKKSYALSFILQDSSKTLTDSNIDEVMGKLQSAFVEEVGAELR